MLRLLHPSSNQCGKTETDLFSVPMTQTVIEESIFTEINPVSILSSTESIIEFVIPSNAELFTDLSESYLYLKGTIVDEKGDTLDPALPIYPENNFLHTFFSNIDVSLNEVNVTGSPSNYAIRAYLETLLNYSEDAKKTHLRSSGFYGDRSLLEADFRDNFSFELYGKLHCDIFHQPRLMLNGVEIKLRFTRSPAAFYLFCDDALAAAKKPIVRIDDIYLYIRRVKLTPHAFLSIERNLLHNTAKYPITRVETRVFTIASGISGKNIDNIILGSLPKRVIVGLLDHSAYNGNYLKNCLEFKHFSLETVALYINGTCFGKPFDLSFDSSNVEKSKCIRGYSSIFSSTGTNNDVSSGINFRHYVKEGCTLFGFVLSQDQCVDSLEHLNPLRQGELSLRVSFANPITNPVSVVVYAEFSQLIEITKTREVLYNP